MSTRAAVLRLAEAVTKAGKAVKLIAAEDYDHFELKETLASPYAPSGRAVLEMIREHEQQ